MPDSTPFADDSMGDPDDQISTMTQSSITDDIISPVRMTSIAHGDMGSTTRNNPNRSLSWSDFTSLMEQTEDMRERIRTLEQRQRQQPGEPAEEEEEEVGLLGQENKPTDSSDQRELQPSESMMDLEDDTYELPESTYTLLMTEHIASIPFVTGIIAAAFSLMCLVLAFMNEFDNRSDGNPFGMPAGVTPTVRLAQYLGVIIGVIMEEEIPQGLEIIGKGAEQSISGGDRFSMRRIFLPSLLRMIVGYTFLACLFLTVFQESSVLGVFFDVLALEFLENIDDIIFELSKRGFFGRKLRVATNRSHCIKGSKESRAFRRWTKRFIRFIYIFNICLGVALLTFATIKQREGAYRCNTVHVDFGDAVWEEAYVTTGVEKGKRLLLYSHFNGIYEEEGRHDGKPMYIERNKEEGSEFKRTIPAEIVYCQDIESWVFRHKYVTTSSDPDKENECSWLLRSPQTESFDITELAEDTEWFVWRGLVHSDYKVHIECVECDNDADCNYKGVCSDETCDCADDYFGTHCQFEQPCEVIRSEKGNTTTLKLLGDPDDEEGEDFVEVYGRPMYVIENLSDKPYGLLRLTHPDDDDKYFNVEYPDSTETDGVGDLVSHKHFHLDSFSDDDFFQLNNQTAEFSQLLKNYTVVLRYTGRRWYGQIVPPGLTATSFQEEEYHAFWNNAFSGLGAEDNKTLIISSPSGSGSPVGLDFYEMRRRNIQFENEIEGFDYGPFGVLIPLVEYAGSGFFHCNNVDPPS